jgi:hypothetical protein
VAAGRVRAPLTDLENDVVQAVWNHGPWSVEAVSQEVSFRVEVALCVGFKKLRDLFPLLHEGLEAGAVAV